MGDRTGIEWTNATWNPLRGCTRVSEGCRNCYAEGVAARFSGPGQPYEGLAKMTKAGARWTGAIRLLPDKLAEPLRWQRPRLIFVNSMSDLFHPNVPDDFIAAVIGVMAFAQHHTFQVLTKRPERMLDFLSQTTLGSCLIAATRYKLPPKTFRADEVERVADTVGWPLPNVWWGVSAEDQDAADERVPLLLATPAAVRWVSAEPLLGPIDFTRLNVSPGGAWLNALAPHYTDAGMNPGLDWVVTGGESGRQGTGIRPMSPMWPQMIDADCRRFGVPHFFKQWGNWRPETDTEALVRPQEDYTNAGIQTVIDPATGHRAIMLETGKRSAGKLLNGQVVHEWPRALEARR